MIHLLTKVLPQLLPQIACKWNTIYLLWNSFVNDMQKLYVSTQNAFDIADPSNCRIHVTYAPTSKWPGSPWVSLLLSG